jgi:hypothetical protein
MFGVTVVLFAVAGYGAVEGHTQFALLALALAAATAVLTIATWWTAPSRIELGVAGVTLWSVAGRATTIPWSDLASVTLAQGRYPRLTWARVDGSPTTSSGLSPMCSASSPTCGGGPHMYG